MKFKLTETEQQYYNQMLQDNNVEEIERIDKLIRERST